MPPEPSHHDLATDLLIVAVPAVIAAIAAVWAAVVNSRRVKNQKAVMADLDTGNEKKIGETVHDIAQLQEIQAAIAHTNTKELLELSQKVIRLDEKLDQHVQESTIVHDFLLTKEGSTLPDVMKRARRKRR